MFLQVLKIFLCCWWVGGDVLWEMNDKAHIFPSSALPVFPLKRRLMNITWMPAAQQTILIIWNSTSRALSSASALSETFTVNMQVNARGCTSISALSLFFRRGFLRDCFESKTSWSGNELTVRFSVWIAALKICTTREAVFTMKQTILLKRWK